MEPVEPVHKLPRPSLGGDEDDDDLSVKGILQKKNAKISTCF